MKTHAEIPNLVGETVGVLGKDVPVAGRVTRSRRLVPFFGPLNRGENGCSENSADGTQGRDYWNVNEVLKQHLQTDENQHYCQPKLQVAELVDDSGEEEIEGTQAKNRADIRCINNERIAGEGENRRYGVGGKDDVSGVDDHHYDEKRRGGKAVAAFRVRLPAEKLVAVEIVGNRDQLARKPQHRIMLGVIRGVVFLKGHPDAGKNQERAEYVESPGEAGNEGGASENHHAAQHESSDDAPEQYPVLILLRHLEVGEDQHEDENIVYGKRVLDEVAGQELETRLLPHRFINGEGERQRQRDPDSTPDRGLPDGNLLTALMEKTEIQREDREDDDVESDPAPECVHWSSAPG